jgi:hypothetical protein
MKHTTLALAALLAGLASSALATAGTPSTSGKTILICHATHARKHPYVLVRVAVSSVHARLQHGDVMPANGTCPGPLAPVTTTATTVTTTASA